MARLQLTFPLLFWAMWRSTPGDRSDVIGPFVGTGVYLAGLLLVVLAVGWRSRVAMRRTTYAYADPVPKFHRTVFFARWFVLGWHAAALWCLGYGDFVLHHVPTFDDRFQSLPTFASVLPVVATWVGLIGAQYPLDRSVREQNALFDVEFGQPVRPVPSRGAYVGHAVRSQILFTLVPLLTIWLLREVLNVSGIGLGWPAGRAAWVSTLAGVGLGFALTPELLRRVLPTRPLPPSALRDRLEAMSRRLRLGVRDILLWSTHHTVANAAVMGLVPGVRYVLISDLLVETMPPDQVEAVFAHEAGHVKHRHIAWYVVFWAIVATGLDPLTEWAANSIVDAGWLTPTAAGVATSVAGLALAVAAFGALSRQFERQADAFAARRMTSGDADTPGRDGTAIFCSALHTVARVNNLPLDARSYTAGRSLVGRVVGRVAHHAATWLHGSIRSRVEHLARLATNAPAARRFDRRMVGLRAGLVVTLAASVWAFVRFGGAL